MIHDEIVPKYVVNFLDEGSEFGYVEHDGEDILDTDEVAHIQGMKEYLNSCCKIFF